MTLASLQWQVRLLRASRIFKRWETKVAIDYTVLEMTKCVALCSLARHGFAVVVVVVIVTRPALPSYGRCVVLCLLASHWFACVWGLQTSLLSESRADSWMGSGGVYCFENATWVDGDGEDWCPDGYVCECELACKPPFTLYAASFYWAVMTITSIGYGDIAATPANSAEQMICAMLMLLGGMMWGYVIGTFCGIIATLNPDSDEFRRNMGDLNKFMVLHEAVIPKPFQLQLREYFHQVRMHARGLSTWPVST